MEKVSVKSIVEAQFDDPTPLVNKPKTGNSQKMYKVNDYKDSF